MKISDEIALSARNLTRRKGRTALTLIGVVIGTCMVVLMISLGIAQTQANDEMLQSWGDLTQIEVYGGGTMVDENGKTIKLDDAAVESFAQLDHVLGATPYAEAYSLNGEISAGRNDRYKADVYNITGIMPDALEPMGFTLQSGTWPQAATSSKATKIQILVCDYTGYNFYDSRKSENSSKRYRWQGETDAQGNELPPFVDADTEDMTLTITVGEDASEKTQSWSLEVVGHLTMDAGKGWWTQGNFIMCVSDLKMIEAAYNKLAKITSTDSQSYYQVYVKVDDINNVEAVDEAIQAMGFTNTYSPNDQREEMQKQVLRSQMIFGGVAAVSLFVAALNIINTMTMAIYERTREIGVMKVLGCELGNIRAMFLFESSAIGFIGGVLGVAISLLASLVLNNLSSILAVFGQQSIDLSGLMGGSYYYYDSSAAVSVIPLWLMLGALVFATLVGLIAGVVPANRAVKISALEAIRHD